MKNLTKVFLILAAALLGLSVGSNAQSVVINGIGSSAQFLQLGEGASSPSGSIDAPCVWSTNAAGVVATDTTVTPSATDTGNAWVAWTEGGGTCAAPGSSSHIYSYLQTDSVVGDRCLFNACTISYASAPAATSGLILGVSGEVSLPSTIRTALDTAPANTVNMAGTDIRPEDAEFAITRATGGPTVTSPPACGSAITQFTGGVGNPTQYEYLGYANGNQIVGFAGSTFNVVNFSLPAEYAVTPLGATPIVVIVNGQSGSANAGFNSPTITNLNRSTLALYLDGTIGNTADGFTPGASPSSPAPTPETATVFVREPLSGTYNTMEYNIPNNTELQTSQDVGVNQVDINSALSNGRFNRNCNTAHTGPEWNSAGVAMGTLSANPKERAIGTGQEVSSVFNTSNALGYTFWSASNLASAVNFPHARYLTVDGVDPIQTTYTGGTIPTTAAELANVTLANVQNGSYPIWSLLRLVTAGSTTAPTSVTDLAQAAQAFVTATHPDFVPYATSTPPTGPIPALAVERAHFTPPGIYASGSEPVPQNAVNVVDGAPMFPEAGGDVGGLPITYQADSDYCVAYGSGTCTAGHSFTSTQVPSSLRRQ